MRILAIETSCDETAISIIDAVGEEAYAEFRILGNNLLSQAKKHREFGGVYPSLAKREHSKNLVPILKQTLTEAGMWEPRRTALDENMRNDLRTLLVREPELFESLCGLFEEVGKPAIDVIAVTYGPGLEPALWVGINFAKALSLVWDIKIIPVNHMEGHVFAGLLKTKTNSPKVYDISYTEFPVLALLISGGHTELVLMKSWGAYEVVGETRDDAVGEAFDKVARMLSLPYPGGPEISKLAEEARQGNEVLDHKLPRPMLNTENCHFSFSGLKTSVLYFLKKQGAIDEPLKRRVARALEDAITEVLIKKTARALQETEAKMLVIGGGVSANRTIRSAFAKHLKENFPGVTLSIPAPELTTDNAIMIGIAGYFGKHMKQNTVQALEAQGNLPLD